MLGAAERQTSPGRTGGYGLLGGERGRPARRPARGGRVHGSARRSICGSRNRAARRCVWGGRNTRRPSQYCLRWWAAPEPGSRAGRWFRRFPDESHLDLVTARVRMLSSGVVNVAAPDQRRTAAGELRGRVGGDSDDGQALDVSGQRQRARRIFSRTVPAAAASRASARCRCGGGSGRLPSGRPGDRPRPSPSGPGGPCRPAVRRPGRPVRRR